MHILMWSGVAAVVGTQVITLNVEMSGISVDFSFVQLLFHLPFKQNSFFSSISNSKACKF